MPFLAAHDAELSVKEPHWRLLSKVRLAALISAVLSSLMFGLCAHFFTGVQWVSESQAFGTIMGYPCFGAGLGISFVINLVYFVMLCGKWHYLLPAGANVGIECLAWTSMIGTGLTGSFLLSYVPARVYCPREYGDSNYRTGYQWCVKNWDMIKASERGGIVFFFFCFILHFGLFVQACRRVHVERMERKGRRRSQWVDAGKQGGQAQRSLWRSLGRAGRGFRGF